MPNMRENNAVRNGLEPIHDEADLPKCPDCGRAWCEMHTMHFADCTCLDKDRTEKLGLRIVEKDGKLFAKIYKRVTPEP